MDTKPLQTETRLYLNLPQMAYQDVLALQHRTVAARHEGRLEHDVILLVEHPPVFTLGRNGGRENLIVSEDFLRGRGVTVAQIERGGDITYHGPGQLVTYPILDLGGMRLGVKDYVALLETAMIRTAGAWGVHAASDPNRPGVWVGGKKLGSIGIAVRRGITFHGLALNVNLSLEPFTWINPCGLAGVRMTSMSAESELKISMDEVREVMVREMGALFGGEVLWVGLEELRNL